MSKKEPRLTECAKDRCVLFVVSVSSEIGECPDGREGEKGRRDCGLFLSMLGDSALLSSVTDFVSRRVIFWQLRRMTESNGEEILETERGRMSK